MSSDSSGKDFCFSNVDEKEDFVGDDGFYLRIEEEDVGVWKYDVGIEDGYEDGSLFLNDAEIYSDTADSNEADLLLLFDESDIIFFLAFCFGDDFNGGVITLRFERDNVFVVFNGEGSTKVFVEDTFFSV